MATPVAAPALPNVSLIYGPMLIGVFFNMILFGVLLIQTLTYYQNYKNDSIWMRLFVAYIVIVETANTGFDMMVMYQPLIMEYGQKPVYFPLFFMTDPLCIVLVSMPIQLFFAWRIYRLRKNPYIAIVIVLFAVASFAGGLWTTIMIQIYRLFAKKPLLHAPALLWFLASCVADVLITLFLVLTLAKKKTGFKATDSVVDKIIRMTIQTGLITAVYSILDVVCFMVLPHLAVNFVWDLALSKLYSNCLLSTLNARHGLNGASYASGAFQQPRSLTLSSGGRAVGSGKIENTLTSYALDVGQDGDPDADWGSGIHMTKIVERKEDPMP